MVDNQQLAPADRRLLARENKLMTEREVLAQQIAGERYALGIDDPNGRREYESGRLFPNERKAFDAGWEAAKAYYKVQQQ